MINSRIKTVQAPFTTEQIDKINKFQNLSWFDVFVCQYNKCDKQLLVAKLEGLYCKNCTYTQYWVYEYMLEPLGEDILRILDSSERKSKIELQITELNLELQEINKQQEKVKYLHLLNKYFRCGDNLEECVIYRKILGIENIDMCNMFQFYIYNRGGRKFYSTEIFYDTSIISMINFIEITKEEFNEAWSKVQEAINTII